MLAAMSRLRRYEMTPKIGDQAVYPAQGVAEFTAIESKEVMGRKMTFYVLKVLDSNKKIMIPIEKLESVGLRPVIDNKEVAEVYAILRARDVNISEETWVRRYRSYDEKMKTGSIHEIAEVLRDLNLRKFEKDLSFGERRMLDTARRLIVQEVSIAKKTTKEEIEEEIDHVFT
jgi:CarD family transcriptional regulator